jgi:hypothetical protein
VPSFLFGGAVCNIYYLGRQKFFSFSTTCHNQDSLCQVDDIILSV